MAVSRAVDGARLRGGRALLLGPHGLRQLAAAALAGCCLALGACGESDDAEPAPRRTAVVERVVDGDTLRLEGLGRVRVIGVDTPELHPSAEPCARAASAFVAELLPPGVRVGYQPGEESRDRYGRLLADVRLPDGRDLAKLLAKRGLARPLTIPPNDRHADELAAAVARARAAGRGVWGGACSG